MLLARFDPTPSIRDAAAEFTTKATSAGKADAPACGDEVAAGTAGVQVSSEPTDLVRWCVGVDTIEADPSGSAADVDYATEGVQATVLRLANTGRMFREVGYPEAWSPVDGSGLGLPGQELRERLGLAGSTRGGLATQLLPPGQTLTLLLPGDGADASGTVTADLSAAAWTLSAVDFASSTYTRLLAGVDNELGDAAWAARESLLVALTDPEAPEDPEELQEVAECLVPVAETILMNTEVAQQLLAQAFECAAQTLRPALPEQYGVSPAAMADAVATRVLTGLPSALAEEAAPWAEVSDAMTDPQAGQQVWVGPPPAEEHDYSAAPHVFRPGDEIVVPEWSSEFTAYVEGRLALLLQDAGVDEAASCPGGAFSVSRYRTDGFALAEQVSCDGEEWRLVLGRVEGGWQELDQIQQDPYFGCSVLGTYGVPAFIAGDTCLDGEQTQEYTG